MPTGQRTTYSDTITQKRVVTDLISIIDPMEVPLLNAIGYGSENVKKFKFVNFPGTQIEWLEDTYAARAATAAATNITNDSTTTTIAVASGHGARFQKGHVILIDAEYMWVSSIATDTVTVVRNYGGTQATHASTSAITIVTVARVEGADADDSPTTTPTSSTNLSQILQKKIAMSGTRQKVTQYGISNEFDREVEKAMKELTLYLENVAFYGVRKAGSGSASRSAGGLDTFITTNLTTLSGSPALTQKNIEDAVQNAWAAGGNPNLLVCGGWALRKIRDFYSPSVRSTPSEKRGGVLIDKIMTTSGELDVLPDRNCSPTKLYILDSDRAGYVPIREFETEDLAKTGDADNAEVVGEFSLVVANEKAHAIVSGFSISK